MFCLDLCSEKPRNIKKKIGILRIDYDYPPIPGDVDDSSSFEFDIEYEIVKGLTFEKAQVGYIDNSIIVALKIAIRKLEQYNVVGLSGDCGFMMAYQKLIRRMTKLPVFMSSLLQTSILASSTEENEKIAILTANSETLEPNLPKLLTECGILVDLNKFYVIGCQDVPGFEAVANGEKVDYLTVSKGIKNKVFEKLAEYPNTTGFLMECTELPCYSDMLRYETALPVFDAITLINLFYRSCTDNPNFGLNNW